MALGFSRQACGVDADGSGVRRLKPKFRRTPPTPIKHCISRGLRCIISSLNTVRFPNYLSRFVPRNSFSVFKICYVISVRTPSKFQFFSFLNFPTFSLSHFPLSHFPTFPLSHSNHMPAKKNRRCQEIQIF